MIFRHILFALTAIAAKNSNAASLKENLNGIEARQAQDFLNTIGVCLHIQHGQDPQKIIPLLQYTGIRNVRDAADGNYDMSGLLQINRQTGVKIVIGPGSGVSDKDFKATVEMARELHRAGALLAIEGPNEPNNFGGLTYRNVPGGKDLSWLPVAEFQRDLYTVIKTDSELNAYPVYGVSEVGAQTDNCGLQFLRIPDSAETLMESGTRYADFANCHNYMYHPGWPGAPHDNQVWNAADPTSSCRADGLHANFGKTWLKGFQGYSEDELATLPKVTTETGVRIGDCDGAITEHIQGCNYMNLFLAQFKRGWDKTFIYEFIDDPDGAFGFYGADCATRRKSAFYLHNLTTLLDDSAPGVTPVSLRYTLLPPVPATIHDLLLQKSDGELWLIVWGENVGATSEVTILFKDSVKGAEVYDPTVGTAPVAMLTFNGKKDPSAVARLEVSDHPLMLKLIR